jgi:hypothetical protein
MDDESPFIHDSQPQHVYDAFNEFMFSSDRKLFAKLMSKIFFLEMTLDIPGDIVELGVFKGSGVLGWLKSNASLSINSKIVYGFDIFNDAKLVSSIETTDAKLMKSLFASRGFNPVGYSDELTRIILKAGFQNFEIIPGDVFDTIPVFLASYPGFRASIINLDLDVAKPTLFCMEQLWDRLVRGGVMIFDEYGIREWTESDAVDEFTSKKGLKIISTRFNSPSAYIVKD